MYRDRERQITLQDNPLNFIGASLNPQNRWVQLVKLIPWMKIEEKYNQAFENSKEGNPAKSCRMAIGSLIIKERMHLSDRETVEMIAEHPYLQYFIGMDSFQSSTPFDASTMTMFRKRLTPEMMEDINRMIIDQESNDDPDDQEPSSSDGSGKGVDTHANSEVPNAGTVILDATCAPADIHYPTDVSLLSESREKLEELIDTLHDSRQGAKPRTYQENARRDYLRFVRSRKPRLKTIRKAIRQQLGYVRRDLEIIEKLLTDSKSRLSSGQEQYLKTIRELYRQQQAMHKNRLHRTSDRIVSIHQPWVRPIVRGKATADVEFGAKISISMVDGYASIEKLD